MGEVGFEPTKQRDHRCRGLIALRLPSSIPLFSPLSQIQTDKIYNSISYHFRCLTTWLPLRMVEWAGVEPAITVYQPKYLLYAIPFVVCHLLARYDYTIFCKRFQFAKCTNFSILFVHFALFVTFPIVCRSFQKIFEPCVLHNISWCFPPFPCLH